LALGVAAVGLAEARGDARAAWAAADQLAAELARVSDPPDLLARWCAVARARVLLMSGDPDAVVLALGSPEGVGFPAALERVALGRAHLALGHPDRLPALLEPLTGPAAALLGPSVEARILLALAADRQHRETAALVLLTEAIDLAGPAGLIQPFLDAGQGASGLITRHRRVVARHLDFTRQLLPRTPASDQHPVAMVGEHPTEREQIVLRYLPTMLKASEIANELYLSVNTVKTHMRSIYRKLDASNRREAVERARDLNLL
jgi:LuxR family maltose regulon positive regulatory protein